MKKLLLSGFGIHEYESLRIDHFFRWNLPWVSTDRKGKQSRWRDYRI